MMHAHSTHAGAFLQRREFDELRTQEARRIIVTPAAIEDLPALLAFTAREIPALAAAEPAVVKVQRHNPNSILAFRRGSETVGAYAMLFLNRSGLEEVLLGELNTADPDLRRLTAPDEPAAGIYFWAVVARGMAIEGLRTVSARLAVPTCATANIYTCPINDEAVRIVTHVGFKPVNSGRAGLHRYVRLCNRASELPLAA
jgi:hypothetical protein